jgi:hypothetical protein
MQLSLDRRRFLKHLGGLGGARPRLHGRLGAVRRVDGSARKAERGSPVQAAGARAQPTVTMAFGGLHKLAFFPQIRQGFAIGPRAQAATRSVSRLFPATRNWTRECRIASRVHHIVMCAADARPACASCEASCRTTYSASSCTPPRSDEPIRYWYRNPTKPTPGTVAMMPRRCSG